MGDEAPAAPPFEGAEEVAPGLWFGPRMLPAWNRLAEVLADGARHPFEDLLEGMAEAAPDLAPATIRNILYTAARVGTLRKLGKGPRSTYQLASSALDDHVADDGHADEEPPPAPLESNGTCKWCKTPVRWVAHHVRPDQRKPLDLEAVPYDRGATSGRVVVIGTDEFAYVSERRRREAPGWIYVSHVERCPAQPHQRRGYERGSCRICFDEGQIAVDMPEPAYGPSWGPIFAGLCTRCRDAFLDEAEIAATDVYEALRQACDRGMCIGFRIATSLVEEYANSGAPADEARAVLLDFLSKAGLKPLPPRPAPEAEHGSAIESPGAMPDGSADATGEAGE